MFRQECSSSRTFSDVYRVHSDCSCYQFSNFIFQKEKKEVLHIILPNIKIPFSLTFDAQFMGSYVIFFNFLQLGEIMISNESPYPQMKVIILNSAIPSKNTVSANIKHSRYFR